jgi:predicted nucleic-acid-binding protein
MLQFFRDFKKYSRLLNITFLQFTEIMKTLEDEIKIPRDIVFKIIDTRIDSINALVKAGDFKNSATKEYSRHQRIFLAILQIHRDPPLGGWEWDG